MNFKNIRLSERNQVQKATYCRIPFCRKCLEKAHLLKQKADQQLLKAVIRVRLTVNKHTGTFGYNGNVLKLVRLDGCIALYKFTKIIVHL